MESGELMLIEEFGRLEGVYGGDRGVLLITHISYFWGREKEVWREEQLGGREGGRGGEADGGGGRGLIGIGIGIGDARQGERKASGLV